MLERPQARPSAGCPFLQFTPAQSTAGGALFSAMFGPFPAAARIWPKHVSSDALRTSNNLNRAATAGRPRISPGGLLHLLLTWQSVHHGLAPCASSHRTANDDTNDCCVLVLLVETSTAGIGGISAAAWLRHGQCIAPTRTVQSQCKPAK